MIENPQITKFDGTEPKNSSNLVDHHRQIINSTYLSDSQHIPPPMSGSSELADHQLGLSATKPVSTLPENAQLSLGAKLAMFLLIGTTLIVIAATLYDLYLRRRNNHLSALHNCTIGSEEGEKRPSRTGEPKSLLKQVLLSLSFYHSAAIILAKSPEKRTGATRSRAACFSELACHLGPSQLSASCRLGATRCLVGQRSRLPSLSSITEASSCAAGRQEVAAAGEQDRPNKGSRCACFEHEPVQQHCYEYLQHLIKPTHPEEADETDDEEQQQQQQQRQRQHDERQSIDSLHGLRFLSMIWIIVVHSYTLATRWSFFKNNSALDNIYKTAASQLLSNGTFACDSFFFTGGFLLAYLAFPDTHGKRRFQQQQQVASSSSKYKCKCKLKAAAAATATMAALHGGRLCPARSCCSSPDSAQQCRQPVAAAAAAVAASLFAGQQEPDTLSQSSYADLRQCNCLAGASLSSSSSSSSSSSTTTASSSATCSTSAANLMPKFKANEFNFNRVLENLLHRYIRMMPLMMAVIGLSVTSLRFLGEGPAWDASTMMFDKWCRKNWWINALFLHNFINRENMCLSHSWYSAVDIQLFLVGQLVLLALYKSKPIGLFICSILLLMGPIVTGTLTLLHHLPAVPLMISSVSEQSLGLYYGEIYIKPYCRAAPYLIGIILAYLMRTTSLGQARLKKWQVVVGWSAALSCLLVILLATQPAMNGQAPGELASALYSALSRPLWALATGWMIFACITKHGGPFEVILSVPCFVPLSRLTYPAFLIHPIVMAVFYGSRQESFSHYLMFYLILGHIVITYVLAFILSALFELPILSAERAIKRARQAK